MSRRHDWNARWIAASDAVPEGFSRTLFRSSFVVDRLPSDAAEIRISADASYVLYLNGREVGRGPERMQPRRKTHDRIDVSAHVAVGRNQLACIVTHYATSNASWQRAVPSGALGTRAALLLDLCIDGRQLGQALSWTTRTSSAWEAIPAAGLEGVPSIGFDARLLSPRWRDTDFDDTSWTTGVLLGAGHRMHLGSAAPPAAPFGAVPERESPQPTDAPRLPALRSWPLRGGIPSAQLHPATRAGLAFQQVMTPSPGADPHPRAMVYRLDFGEVVSGILEFDLEVPGGTVVDVAFAEDPDGFDDGALATKSGARYTARGIGDRFSTVERYGMRAAFVLVVLPDGHDGPMSVTNPQLRERLRPWDDAVPFSAADEDYAALWRAGIRTTALNTIDGFTDCPTREQRSWVGDGVVHAGVHLVANRDWGAVAEYLVQADSPRSDGILPMSVAGDLEARDGVTIPAWSLHWIHALREYGLHAGVAGLERHLPTARRILDWFAERQTSPGVLGPTGEWDLLDWSSVYIGEHSAGLSALWARALKDYAALADELGDAGASGWAAAHHRAVSDAFERFWDDGRGLYVDYLVSGETRSEAPVSQVTNAAAITAGIVPEHRVGDIAARIAAPGSLVISSQYATPAGAVDLDRWERISAGERIIDWNLHDVVRAEPFLAAVVHDAYRLAGRHDLVLRALKDWLPFLDGGRSTFGETWRWGTTCHGWSSTPTRDIARSLLGVSPSAVGFASALIEPRAGEGDFSGGVPTPFGDILVGVLGEVLTVSSPVPFELRLPGTASSVFSGPGEFVTTLE